MLPRRRCTECGPLTRAEFYLGNVRGHLLFLPGLPMSWAICGGWSLDLHSLEVRQSLVGTRKLLQQGQLLLHCQNPVLFLILRRAWGIR